MCGLRSTIPDHIYVLSLSIKSLEIFQDVIRKSEYGIADIIATKTDFFSF